MNVEEEFVSVPPQLLKDVLVQLESHQKLLELFEELDDNVWSDYHDKYIHEDEAYFDEEHHDWKLIE